MFDRKRKEGRLRDSIIGSVFVSMAQAAIATSNETDRPSESRKVLFDLILSTVTRTEVELSEGQRVQPIIDLIMNLGEIDSTRQVWKMFAEFNLDDQLVEKLGTQLSDLGDKERPSESYLLLILSQFGWVPEEAFPFVYQVLGMHAALTMQIVFQDTKHVGEVEQMEQRFWASFYIAMMVATWRDWEKLAVKYQRPLGYDPRF